MRKMKNKKPLGLASEMIIEQMRRTRFWFCAFIVAFTAFIISCIKEMMQK